MTLDLPIPPGHELFLIEVEAEATQRKDVLVMAENAVMARAIARREVSFSSFDFDDWDVGTVSRVVKPQDVIDDEYLESEAYISWPIGSRQDSEVNARELLDLLLTSSAETAQRLRWARIEADNGQAPLPLSTPVTITP